MPFTAKKLTPIKTDSLENLGSSVVDLAKTVEDEFGQVASSLQATEPDHIWNVPPPKPRRGTYAYADGTHWNPGSGEGPYYYSSSGLWLPLGSSSSINPIVGTASYTFQPSDIGKLVYFSNTGPVAVSANPATLGSGWWCWVQNYNTGVATITPTSGAIDNNPTLHLYDYEKIRLWSDGINLWSDSHSGEWLGFTPPCTPAGGAFTNVTGSMRYKKIRTTIHYQVQVIMTNAGTGSGYLNVGLPIAAGGAITMMGGGEELAINGKALCALIQAGGGAMQVRYYDNGATATPVNNGAGYIISGFYEAFP